MLRRTLPRKPNGHAGPGRPNGHGPDSVPACDAGLVPASPAQTPGRERGGGPVSACPCPPGSHPGRAASDDASRTSVASVEALRATASLHEQASTVCEAYAVAAPPPTQGLAHGSQEEGKSRSATGNQPRHTDNHPQEIPGGETPLPPNAGDFVEEVHRETDLFKVWRSLLQSEDEKIRQRAVEKLTEMRYKGATALADESQRIIIDMPGPTRD